MNHSLLNTQSNKAKTIRIVSEIARNDRQAVVRSVRIKRKLTRNVRNHAKQAKIQIQIIVQLLKAESMYFLS